MKISTIKYLFGSNSENMQKLENIVNTFNCPNGYTKNNISDSFFETDSEAKVCEGCNNFNYSNGIASCSLISQII